MGMDRPDSTKSCSKRHQAGSWLEPTRKAESGSTQTDLAQEYRRRGEGRRNDMGRAEEDLPEQPPLEESCGGPIFRKE